ncbi:MAG: DUF1800 domain-containing protein [Flammeovirgaceae bacterium]
MANLTEKKKSINKRDKVLARGNKKTPQFPRQIAGLEESSSEWNFEKAAHLLRRTTIGPTYNEITESVKDGLDKTLTKLLDDTTKSFDPPLNFLDEEDPEIPLGETWINAERKKNDSKRENSYAAWRVSLILNKKEPISIRENMVLFWQNHFATEAAVVNDARYVYWMHDRFRNNFLGNFKNLVKKVNVDAMMLVYLSGIYNVKEAPNENYARELFELFTIGKGPIDGDDSYTYYTESDIIEASKVLTGWQVRQNFSGSERQFFNPERHDTSTKNFSSKFSNKSIANNNDKEHEDLIDLIFESDRVSEYICEKIYRWFVYYVIDEEVKTKIILPLAKIFRDNNYEIKPVLEALFKSTHFFESHTLGAKIKGPIDFSLGAIRQMPFTEYEDFNFRNKYFFWRGKHSNVSDQGQSIIDSPNVAGWPAFYQGPLYHEYWISSVTLPMRTTQIKSFLSNNGIRGFGDGLTIVSNPMEFVLGLETPKDINFIVEEFCNWLLPVSDEITSNTKEELVDIINGGNPNIWEDELTEYLSDPSENKKEDLNKKLRLLLKELCLMPEYYLS